MNTERRGPNVEGRGSRVAGRADADASHAGPDANSAAGPFAPQPRSYQKLDVWQAAMDLVDAVYTASRRWPDDERYGLISQTRRAAVSVPANIAEGYGRLHRKEYLHHLSIARGSLLEVETLMLAATRVGVAAADDQRQIEPLIDRTSALLTGLLRSLAFSDVGNRAKNVKPARRPGVHPRNADAVDPAKRATQPHRRDPRPATRPSQQTSEGGERVP